jgi:hypothetical protein
MYNPYLVLISGPPGSGVFGIEKKFVSILNTGCTTASRNRK